MNCHVSNKTFTIQCIGSLAQGSTWHPLIQDSAKAWNDTVFSDITISTSTASRFTCEVKSYAEDWFGIAKIKFSNGETISASIQINTRTCDSGNNPRKSTITHEIGHLLGLSDNPPVNNNKSLMNHGRDREVVFQPQLFDIENVKYIYEN